MGSLCQFIFERIQVEDDLKALEASTGIKKGWLYQFKRGHIPNPGVNTVQKLYEHFKGSALEV